MNQLGSREEAEDAVQSTFLNAHRALQRGVEPEAELAWLFKIAHNVCLTRRRSTSRRGRVESAHDLDAMQDYLPAPARESSDELIRLTDALAHMPDNQRRAILLREWQGLSYSEIARELKLSQSAVETLIFRARRSLAANLETAPEKTPVLARARQALEVAWLIPVVKGLFSGGAAVKAAAAAVAVSGAAVVATAPSDAPSPAKRTPVVQKQEHAAPVAPLRLVESAPRVDDAGAVAADAPRQAISRPVAKAQPSRPSAKAPAVGDPTREPAAPAREVAPAAVVEPTAPPTSGKGNGANGAPADKPKPETKQEARAQAPAAQSPGQAKKTERTQPAANDTGHANADKDKTHKRDQAATAPPVADPAPESPVAAPAGDVAPAPEQAKHADHGNGKPDDTGNGKK